MNRLLTFTLLCFLLLSSCVTQRLQRVAAVPPAVTTAEFAEDLARVAKTPWTSGNDIRTLENGGVFFPAMLKAIQGAQRTITFESFVNTSSLPVDRFSKAFAERARAGVHVHLILDAYASKFYGEKYLNLMREAGVEVKLYNPPDKWHPLRYLHRTHRRVLVVDGVTGFTGGAGLTNRWIGHAQAPRYWRDTQYELRGPVVRQLQENFNDNWQEMTGQPLTGPDYFPALTAQGGLTAQMALGSPQKLGDTLGSSALLSFRAARESILISHAYFVPTEPLIDALIAAVRRGVHVEVIVPGDKMDFSLLRQGSMSTLRRLAKAGVEVYEYQPTMMHGKLVVVDGHVTLAGSGNLDPRSFFLNDENNLHVLSTPFAASQRQMFERDKARSKRRTPAELRNPWNKVPRAFMAQLIRCQL